jgi:hypothetical protein
MEKSWTPEGRPDRNASKRKNAASGAGVSAKAFNSTGISSVRISLARVLRVAR